MANKSEMFKGLIATDFHATFRTDIAAFVPLSPDKAAVLAEIVIEDARNVVAASTSVLSKIICEKLGVPTRQSISLARAARSFSARLGRTDDEPGLIVDDLIQMQVIPPTGRDALLKFLTVIRQQRNELTKRLARQVAVFGGGYHLGDCSVFTDYRVAFDRIDPNDVNLDTYEPTIAGLVPMVTLVLEIHQAGEEEKAIALRLAETDLVKVEESLKLARLQLAAAKKRLAAGGQ
jgi:hypothetical protein